VNAGVAISLLQLWLDAQVGSSTAPYVTPTLPEVSGYGGVLSFGAQYRLTPRLNLSARAALAVMRVEQPAGALYDEAAWANPELGLGFEQPLVTSKAWSLGLSSRLALGLPLAEHDSEASQLEGRALTLANAFVGFGEPELFTPGVLPATPATALWFRAQRWELFAGLKVPLLFRVSNASLPTDVTRHAFGVTPVLDLGARFRALRWLTLGFEPRLTWRARAPIADRGGALQPLLAASAELHVLDAMSVRTSVQAPIAGPLGGSTLAFTLSLLARF